MGEFSIGLFNDSFPPIIDGVAQTVKNYADYLCRKDCDVTVVTPYYRGVEDHYPYEVFRYPSIPASSLIGYRVGMPFAPDTLIKLKNRKFDIMHVHAPFASSVLVSNINHPHVPTVLTYHTKFDVDFKKRIPNAAMRKIALDFVLHNVNAADEVWVVTEGCGQALRNIGYEGTYRIMENGTDFARGLASPEEINALRETYHIYEDIPIFLFVGRMMWYKNVRLILDALKILYNNGIPFRALMVGDGYDIADMRNYTQLCGLQNWVTFTGPVLSREHLRAYYSLADLFLFPSTFDTCGIVVKEAAACNCPSLLVQGSCAAEGVQDKVSGYLTDENPEACAAVLMDACTNRAEMRKIGVRAGKELYLSWEEVVDRVYQRYREILNRC